LDVLIVHFQTSNYVALKLLKIDFYATHFVAHIPTIKTSQAHRSGVFMTSTLLTLVRDNPCANALIGAVARKYPSNRAISAWQAKVLMQAEGETYTEDQATQCMHAMAALGLGYVRQDAGNGDYGFVWALLPLIAYELIRTGQPAIPEGFVRFKADEGDVDEWPNLLTIHTFQLRPNCAATLELPDGLTRDEVRQLNRFLKALVQEESDDSSHGSAWNFPTTSDHFEDDFPEDDFPEEDAEDDETEDLSDDSPDDEVDNDDVEEDENFLLPMSVMEDPVFPLQSVQKMKKAKQGKKSKVDWNKF
jgi:hypothetical protein